MDGEDVVEELYNERIEHWGGGSKKGAEREKKR